jgi:hypothetical protein
LKRSIDCFLNSPACDCHLPGFFFVKIVRAQGAFCSREGKMAALSLIECGLLIQNKGGAAHLGVASNFGRKTRL